MASPFVLLDDVRAGRARMYREPVETVAAHTLDEIAPVLDRLRGAEGNWAGFLSYEAGAAFAGGRAADVDDLPLLWFARFDRVETIDAALVLPDAVGARAGTPVPLIERATYLDRAATVLEAIRAGRVYQANLSFPADISVLGTAPALYAGLRRRQAMAHGALVFTGDDWLLSLSPELFFTVDGDRVVARPMKGTAPADADPASLSNDPKQRAENLMIVDLIRNDLSRVAVAGSVRVPRLFAVERYPTLTQMVSEVEARLKPGTHPVDILAAAFPCGSITGAPKIEAMALLAEVEARPRGIYTGAIGAMSAGAADFNVAIRTLHLKPGASVARIGLGSAIVADSVPADEWRECLQKGAFVASPEPIALIETMALDPEEGLPLLDRHLERMRASAAALGFAFDRHALRNELQAATFRLREPSVVRTLADAGGAFAIVTAPAPRAPAGPFDVAIVPLPVDPGDYRLRHKTSDRAFYDDARAAAGVDEVLFADPDGFLTEGSFTSLFVERDGTLLTPPADRGLLPGVLRAQLLNEGRAVEADLTAADLTGGFLVGNAVRGLLPARLARL